MSTDGNIWRYLTATLGPDLAARAGRVKEIETAWIEAFTGMTCLVALSLDYTISLPF